MGFGGSSGGGGSLGTATDVALNNPANNQALVYDGSVGKWKNAALSASAGVTSVNTRTGDITLTKSDVGLGNADNTSDASKPVSTAVQTALNGKENTISTGANSQYFRGDKSWQTLDKSAVGLGNVDNTSDTSKPVSTATQTALNGKANTSHTHLRADITDIGLKVVAQATAPSDTSVIWVKTS